MKINNKCSHYWDIDPTTMAKNYKSNERIICNKCDKIKEVKFSDPILKQIQKRYIEENLNPKLKFKEARTNKK